MMLRQGRSEFFIRAEPERSEGGWSEEIKNREGVASGSATWNCAKLQYNKFDYYSFSSIIAADTCRLLTKKYILVHHNMG